MAMTSLERFVCTLKGVQTDRMPTALHNFSLCAKKSAMTFDKFVLDPQAMAEAQIRLHEEFDHDVLMVENGTAALAEALGCQIAYRPDDPPVTVGGAVSCLEEIADLQVDERILASPMIKSNLEAVRLLRQHYGDRVVVMGRGDQGPFSLASLAVGMETMLVEILDEENEEWIHLLLSKCVQAETIYCKALLEAGAHCTSIGDSTAGPAVISPALYRKFGVPYEKQLCDNVHRMGGLISLHICGNATAIIPEMISTGADILELDQTTDTVAAYSLTAGKTTIMGQISPVTLAQGTPEQVRAETEQMLANVGGKKAGGVILGAGCAIGGNTSYRNIHAMLDCVFR